MRRVDVASSILSIAICADEAHLVSGSRDGHVSMWSFPAMEVVRRLKRHSRLVRSVAVDESQGLIASGSFDHTVVLSFGQEDILGGPQVVDGDDDDACKAAVD